MDQLPYPDEDLPERQMSLAQFNQRALRYLEQAEYIGHAAFVQFVLAGRYEHHQESRRAILDPELDAVPLVQEELTLTRDFDSLIGISTNLPFTTSFNIFPVPPFRDTMIADNHLLYSFRRPVRWYSSFHCLY